MTTGWLIVNIVLVAVVAALVTVPAVLIPNILHRETQLERRETALEAEVALVERSRRVPKPASPRQPAPSRGRVADVQRRQVA